MTLIQSCKKRPKTKRYFKINKKKNENRVYFFKIINVYLHFRYFNHILVDQLKIEDEELDNPLFQKNLKLNKKKSFGFRVLDKEYTFSEKIKSKIKTITPYLKLQNIY